MRTAYFEGPTGSLAYHETPGSGRPVVLVHGNSASSKAYIRQLTAPLGQSRRLVAFDLPGHGQSDNADEPSHYSLPGYAGAMIAFAKGLGLEEAVFVGWSLGGHIVLEAAPDLPKAAGFVIFGTPPLAFPPAMDKAFLPNPAMGVGFSAEVSREQAESYATSGFRPGYADIAPSFVEDILRTDGRARAGLAASIAPGGYRDEVEIVAKLSQPLAVLHGAEEQLVNRAYFETLTMPTLWRNSVQVIVGAGHAPQWEKAQAFNALLDAFVETCG
ncbi:MAG TPA: alpha/beta fold hydrolase [Roseiarcus sp.]|nr:alpha/beta fold hydrolase [Roseiarcus sp.]